jgi:uncharacterized protein (TIGR02246 family)
MSGLTTLQPRETHEFIRSWEEWFNEGDYETMAAFYAEDARLIATDAPTVNGRRAIAEFLRAAGEHTRAAGLLRTVHLDGVGSAGELGYMRGTVVLSRPGTPEATTVRYLTLWRRQADGEWRLIEDISSRAPR